MFPGKIRDHRMWMIVLIVVLLTLVYLLYKSPSLRNEVLHFATHEPAVAEAVFAGDKIRGSIEFREDNGTRIHVKLSGVPPGEHGLHIHEYGNVESPGKHFNPTLVSHGDVDVGHVGDLGNVEANSEGNVDKVIHSNVIQTHGRNSIIGRTIVIHERRDDLGTTNHPDSTINGNSGTRLAVAIIGVAHA